MSMTNHQTNQLMYSTADSFIAAGGVVHAFSTRLGGVSTGPFASLNLGANRGDLPSRVDENYRILCTAIGANKNRMVFSRQVHKAAVRLVTAADAGKGLNRPLDYEADGLITDVPDLPLVVFSADCIPILLYDPVRRAIGAVHAGWRGTALAIGRKAAEKMVDSFGCETKHMLAAIGPGLGQCCFETHGDVPDAMIEAFGGGVTPFLMQTGEKWHVDLKGINRFLLQTAGIPEANISTSPDCTKCHPDRYWSHRVMGEERGSLASIISLTTKERQ